MATLWTFGDSHTMGTGCITGCEYYEKYKQDGDRIWPEFVANHFSLELQNKGWSGSSNDMIINQIIDNWEQIHPGDIVIIGQTDSNRFDVPFVKNKEWITIRPNDFDRWLDTFNKTKNAIKVTQEDVDLLEQYLVTWRNDSLYAERYYKIFNHYASILKKQNILVVIWNTTASEFMSYETIQNLTNGKIQDLHMSFLGHLQFANWMVKQITHYKTNGLNSIKKSIV